MTSVMAEGPSPRHNAESALFGKLNKELGSWDSHFGVGGSLSAGKRN